MIALRSPHGIGAGASCRPPIVSSRHALLAGARRPLAWALTAVVAGLVALGTAAPPGLASAFSVVDSTGRPVVLPGPPSRIVSLVPSATEIVWAVGGQDRLVGVTDFCDFPPEAREKPRVGGMIAPSLEAVVALRPDVVVVTSAGNRRETFDQLRRLGIPTYQVAPESVEDALAVVVRLGELVGRAPAGQALAADLRRRIDAVAARVAPLPRPRVLYVVWPDPLIVPGRGALISELIRLAGGESVTADVPGAYPRYSAEAAIARGPEVIFLARHAAGLAGADGAARDPLARERWERFGSLPAIRSGRLHEVDGGRLHRYGPRMVDGLEALARLIHPGALGSSADLPAFLAAASGPVPAATGPLPPAPAAITRGSPPACTPAAGRSPIRRRRRRPGLMLGADRQARAG